MRKVYKQSVQAPLFSHTYVDVETKNWIYIKIENQNGYDRLESMIDELVDFASDIREAEPNWRKDHDK